MPPRGGLVQVCPETEVVPHADINLCGHRQCFEAVIPALTCPCRGAHAWVAFATEVSPSGLGRTLGKRVGGNPSRVRISYPPRATASTPWSGAVGVFTDLDRRVIPPQLRPVPFCAVACPSGLRSTPRKRVRVHALRGFKSHRHRHAQGPSRLLGVGLVCGR